MRSSTVLKLALLAFLAAFLIYPIAYVIPGATVEPTDGTNRLTGYYFALVFSDPFLWQCVLNSLLLAGIVTLLTTLVSLPLALWFTRYEFPARTLAGGLLLVPLILPPFVGAVGLRQFFARFGTVNLLLMDAGLIREPIDWFGDGGFWGVVLMEVLHLYPIMYLNVAAALANVDPALEEAARNLGSSESQVFRRVTFPLMLPGYFAGAAIVFIWAFTDLGTPLVFGYRRVVALQVFERIGDVESNPVGYALVVVTLVITAALFYATRWAVGRRQFTMHGKGGVGTRRKRPGLLRTTGILAFTGGLVLVALMPHLGVVLTSLAERWSFTPLPTQYTGQYYSLALTHPLAGLSISNSLLYSLCSTALDIVLGLSIAYLVVRRRSWLTGLLDGLAMLPLALPGLVIAFGYLTCYDFGLLAERLMTGGPLARSVGSVLEGVTALLGDPKQFPVLLLIVAYAVRRLPYMTRAALAGLQQSSPVFEEAAENLGASRWRVLRTVTLPLVAANVVAGCILTFSFAMLEVSDSLMLAQKQDYYPITKAIVWLLGRPDDGPFVASALGVLGMVLLMVSLLVATAALGRRMGEIFRT